MISRGIRFEESELLDEYEMFQKSDTSEVKDFREHLETPHWILQKRYFDSIIADESLPF